MKKMMTLSQPLIKEDNDSFAAESMGNVICVLVPSPVPMAIYVPSPIDVENDGVESDS